MEKAYFFPRLLAYLIDMVIVVVVSTLIGSVVPVSENYDMLVEESKMLQEKYINQEISVSEFSRQYALIAHDLDYASVMVYIVQIMIMIAYFIVFQFYQNGQTLGKRFMKIRVVSIDDRKLNVNDYIYRSMILNSVLVNIFIVVFALFVNRDFYFYTSYPLQFIQIIVLLITAFMVLFRKDGRGLHDMVGHSKVVMER